MSVIYPKEKLDKAGECDVQSYAVRRLRDQSFFAPGKTEPDVQEDIVTHPGSLPWVNVECNIADNGTRVGWASIVYSGTLRISARAANRADAKRIGEIAQSILVGPGATASEQFCISQGLPKVTKATDSLYVCNLFMPLQIQRPYIGACISN